MRVSFSISVKRGSVTKRYSDKYTDEGNDAVHRDYILTYTVKELKKWLKEIEEEYPELENKNSSLDEHF